MTSPLTPEERADIGSALDAAFAFLPPIAHTRDFLAAFEAARDMGRLLDAERDSLERERDEAREQVRSLTEQLAAAQAEWREERGDVRTLRESVRSLTVERDAERERGDRHNVTIGRVGADLAVVLGQLSRAREALGSFDENPPPYRAGHLVEGGWRIHQARALAALRAALAEPLGGP